MFQNRSPSFRGYCRYWGLIRYSICVGQAKAGHSNVNTSHRVEDSVTDKYMQNIYGSIYGSIYGYMDLYRSSEKQCMNHAS